MSLGSSAACFSFGPVELNVISFEGSSPSPELLHALVEQVDDGNVRLLDFVLIAKSAIGELQIEEIDLDEFTLADLEPYAQGLVAEDDLQQLVRCVPNGRSAAVVVFELLWAKELAEQLALDGDVVVATVRIPAPAVNAAVEMALEA